MGLTGVGALLTSRIATHLYLVDLSTYFSSLLTATEHPPRSMANYAMSTISFLYLLEPKVAHTPSIGALVSSKQEVR